MKHQAWRLTGVLGIAWFVIFVVGGVVLQGEPPPIDQPVAEARQFFASRSGRYLAGDYISGIAFLLCLLPFMAGLRGLLGKLEGSPHIGARLAFAGGLMTVMIGDAATAFTDALALASKHTELPDATLQAMLYANAVAIAAIGLPMALFAFAASAVMWSTRAFPRWVAVLGIVAGGLHLAGAAFPLEGTTRGILFGLRGIGLVTFGIFIVVTSIIMLTSKQLPSANRHDQSGHGEAAS